MEMIPGLICILIVISPLVTVYLLYQLHESDPEAYKDYVLGSANPKLTCPHCGYAGKVRTKPIKKNTGISGGKTAAAIVTGGASILATGLSQKEKVTQAQCDNCGSMWQL